MELVRLESVETFTTTIGLAATVATVANLSVNTNSSTATRAILKWVKTMVVKQQVCLATRYLFE